MAVVVVVRPLNLRSDTEMFTPRRHDDWFFGAGIGREEKELENKIGQRKYPK